MQFGKAISAKRRAWSTLPCLALIGLGTEISALTLVGSNTELRESAIVVASAPMLSNASGTLHLESPTMGELASGRAVGGSGIQLYGGAIPIPEPAALLQLGTGALGLILFDRRRRLRSLSPAGQAENA